MKLQRLFSVWTSLNFISFLSKNDKLEVPKMRGKWSDWLILKVWLITFISCWNCVKFRDSFEVQDMSLTAWRGRRKQYWETQVIWKIKIFQYFYADRILVPRSPSVFYTTDLTNLLVPGVFYPCAPLKTIVTFW